MGQRAFFIPAVEKHYAPPTQTRMEKGRCSRIRVAAVENRQIIVKNTCPGIHVCPLWREKWLRLTVSGSLGLSTNDVKSSSLSLWDAMARPSDATEFPLLWGKPLPELTDEVLSKNTADPLMQGLTLFEQKHGRQLTQYTAPFRLCYRRKNHESISSLLGAMGSNILRERRLPKLSKENTPKIKKGHLLNFISAKNTLHYISVNVNV